MATRTFEKEIVISNKAAKRMIKEMKRVEKEPPRDYIDIRASIDRGVSLLRKGTHRGSNERDRSK